MMGLLNIVWDIDPVIFSIGGLSIRYYSCCWALGIGLALCVLSLVYKKEKINPDLLGSLFIYVVLGVFIGARLGHCLFYDPVYYLSNPLEMLLPIAKDAGGSYTFVGYAGLASHGGVIGIIIAIFIYCRRHRCNVWDILDKLGLVGPLTGAFIRFGNFFNSEIIGTPTDQPWGIIFKQIDGLPRHPSQLYEALSYLVIFAIVSYIYLKRRDKHQYGIVFGTTIALVFIARFAIEYTKELQAVFEEGLLFDMGQILSIPFIVVGIVIVILKYPRKKR